MPQSPARPHPCKKRGQLGLHNKTIHLYNEVVFSERERLAVWMASGPTTGSEGGGEGKGMDMEAP